MVIRFLSVLGLVSSSFSSVSLGTAPYSDYELLKKISNNSEQKISPEVPGGPVIYMEVEGVQEHRVILLGNQGHVSHASIDFGQEEEDRFQGHLQLALNNTSYPRN